MGQKVHRLDKWLSKILNNPLCAPYNRPLSLDSMLHAGIMSNCHSDEFDTNVSVMNEKARGGQWR